MTIVTDDTFFGGRLTVRQPKDGYRYSIDAVLLADFMRCKNGQTVLELGAGCGIIALILAFRYPRLRIFGVEIQEQLARIAAENVRENRLEERIHILHQDLKTLALRQVPDQVQHVICNPPYRRINSGRLNPHKEKAGARHEIFAGLADFAAAAARMLQLSGSLTTIYPAPRLVDLAAHLRRANLEPKRLRMIHSKSGDPARLVLMTGVKGGRPGLEVEPPLVIYGADGGYTEEVAGLFVP